MFKFLSRDQKKDEELGQELASKVSGKEEDSFNSNTKTKSDPLQTDAILVDDPLATSWIDLDNNEKRNLLTQSSPAAIPSHAEEVRTKTTSNSSPNSDRYQRETTTLLKQFPDLPEPEKVIEVFTCSLSTIGGGIAELWDKNGSLYVTDHYLCFLSSTSATKELIAFRDITSIAMKSRQLEITTSLKKVAFTILLSAEEAYNLISLLWQTKGKCNVNTLAASVKYAKENKQLHELFSSVSPFEIVMDHYMCALNLKIQQGRMYLTNYYNVYFYSKIPLYPEVKESFSFESVTGIEKSESSSIEISFADKKLYLRNLFAFRDSCYYQLVSLWERLKFRPKTFGLSLPLLLTRENRNSSVPVFVEKAVAFLSTALDSEGLFRISASRREQEQIQYLIDEGEEIDFFDCQDKNLPAGLLKKFFRDLPECLLTDEFYNCFLTVYESKHLFDDAELLRRLKDLIQQIPYHNRKLTRFMLQFLDQVAAHSSNNKMDQKNLARIWGPILLKSNTSEDVTPDALKTAGEVMDLVLIMIDHQRELFDD